MKDYTVNDPAFSETIQVTETTDTNHADNINYAPKQIFQNTLYNKDSIDELDKSKVDSDSGDISDTVVSSITASTEEMPVPEAGDSTKTVIGKLIKFCNDVKSWYSTVSANLTNLISNQNIKAYYAMSQIGLTNSATLETTFSTLSTYSMLLLDASALTSSTWNLPVSTGTVCIIKHASTRQSKILFFNKTYSTSVGDYVMYVDSSGVPTGEWIDFVNCVGTATIGSTTQHMYMNAGKPTASTANVGNSVFPMYMSNGVFTKLSSVVANTLGTATVGGTAQGIWLNAGAPTAMSANIGSGTRLAYMSNGVWLNSTTSVGGSTKPIYMNGGTLTAFSSNVASSTRLMYMVNGALTASSANAGSGTKPIYMINGVFTAASSTIGSSSKFLYMSNGTFTATSANFGNSTRLMYMVNGSLANSAANVGSRSQPVYMVNGAFVAANATIGSSTKLTYLNAGVITASSANVGSSTKLMYLSSGALTNSSANVGSGTKPVYLSSGTVTVSSSTVGSSGKPVYLNSGTITVCDGAMTYRGVEALGLSTSASPQTIIDTMAYYTILIDAADNLTNSDWDFPDKYGTLVIIKGGASSRVAVFLLGKNSKYDYRRFLGTSSDSDTITGSGWYRISWTAVS